MRKKMILFLICVTLTLSMLIVNANAGNGYVINDFCLIDGGGHLDWDGSSNYMEEWYDAINVWNAYKPGVIRADRWNIIEDVHIYDKPKCKTSNSVIAMTFETGKIEFYQDKMDKMTKTQRQAVIEHEIGHALGLDDTGFWYAIMYYTGPQNFVQLHDADKAGYDAAWEKFVD